MKQKNQHRAASGISWCTWCATKPYCGALQGRKLPNLCADQKSRRDSSKAAEIICLQQVGKLFRDVHNGAKGVSSRTQAYLQDQTYRIR